jgi:hypothetical protein
MHVGPVPVNQPLRTVSPRPLSLLHAVPESENNVATLSTPHPRGRVSGVMLVCPGDDDRHCPVASPAVAEIGDSLNHRSVTSS